MLMDQSNIMICCWWFSGLNISPIEQQILRRQSNDRTTEKEEEVPTKRAAKSMNPPQNTSHSNFKGQKADNCGAKRRWFRHPLASSCPPGRPYPRKTQDPVSKIIRYRTHRTVYSRFVLSYIGLIMYQRDHSLIRLPGHLRNERHLNFPISSKAVVPPLCQPLTSSNTWFRLFHANKYT